MIRLGALLVLLATPMAAQDFGAPPMSGVGEVHACLAAQVAEGANALVSRDARDCIGREVQLCDGLATTCTETEQSYWDWRIAQTYRGLAAWVADSADVDPAVTQSVQNPATATANVALECQLRLSGGEASDVDPAGLAACKLRETALIALELEFTVRQACETARDGAFAAYCEGQ